VCIFTVCLVKIKTRIGLFDHIRGTHGEDQAPGVLFFNTDAGKYIFAFVLVYYHICRSKTVIVIAGLKSYQI